MIESKKLKKFKNIKHGFFNRNGGKSKGIYKLSEKLPNMTQIQQVLIFLVAQK